MRIAEVAAERAACGDGVAPLVTPETSRLFESQLLRDTRQHKRVCGPDHRIFEGGVFTVLTSSVSLAEDQS